jgi:hypothetical protein
LLPAWAVDEIVEHWPARCRCGHVFSADERRAVGHQVEELPPITVRVVEHRCQRLRCPACARRCRGELPAHVAKSCFGPRLQAALATLSVRNRVSRDDAVELVEELFAARISSGTVDAIIDRAAEALAEPHENLLAQLRSSRCLQRQYKPTIRSYAAKRARNKRCRGMARNLLKAWPALWTLATHDGVQPTNNHAERALRSAVIYRKLCLGTQSEHGEQRVARLLSAHTTCRLQGRSLFAYLTDAITAHARGHPAPLLS